MVTITNCRTRESTAREDTWNTHGVSRKRGVVDFIFCRDWGSQRGKKRERENVKLDWSEPIKPSGKVSRTMFWPAAARMVPSLDKTDTF